MSDSDEDRARTAGGYIIRVPADLARLAGVRAFIRERAALAGADPTAISDIVQAVDESVTNAIEHGYSERNGEVEIEVQVDRAAGSLVVRLRDQAPPFDPTSLPAPDTTLPLDRRPLGGMGVYLARELTDAVTYRRTADGNELTLVKECLDQEEGDRAEHPR